MSDPKSNVRPDGSQARALLRAAAGHVFSLAAGLLAALILSYVLYRIGLPSKPFIYAAF